MYVLFATDYSTGNQSCFHVCVYNLQNLNPITQVNAITMHVNNNAG